MKRWILYYGVSLLVAGGVNALLLYKTEGTRGTGGPAFFVFQAAAAVGISIMQLISLILLLTAEKPVPRIPLAFSGIYSLVLCGVYALVAYQLYSSLQTINALNAGVKDWQAYESHTDPFLSFHCILLLPVLFQLILYFFLYRKGKKRKVSLT